MGIRNTRQLIVLLTLVAGVIVALSVLSPTLCRKLLMAFMAPVAAFWVGLACAGLLWLARFRRTAIGVASTVALILFVCSSSLVAHYLLGSLERDYQQFSVEMLEPIDVLLVLGGGLGVRQNGSPELSASGDRVIVAARLYHLGKAKRLITCGDAIPEIGMRASSAIATARLWQELGIPERAIVIGRGASTSEELRFLKEYLAKLQNPSPNLSPGGGEEPMETPSINLSPSASAEQMEGRPLAEKISPPHPNLLPQGGEGTIAEANYLSQDRERTLRVGLVTSAWHMPRALRQAKRNGLDVVPVPADFWSDEQFEFTILSLVPSGEALVGTHRAMLEYVGMAVGR